MRVADIMTRDVITIRPEATVGEAVDTMVNARLSGLPVVAEDDSLVGIVTEGDFLRRPELGMEGPRPKWYERLFRSGNLAETYAQTHGRRVREIMTTSVVTVTQDTSLNDAARMMESRRVKRLPVLSDNRLVGILSRADIVRALAGFVRESYESPPVSDDAIRTNLEREIKSQSWTPGSGIRVAVDNGVVELDGIITDERQRNALRVLAENTPGVTIVHDRLSWMEPYRGIIMPAPEQDKASEA